MLARSSDRLDEVVPLLADLLGVPTGDALSARRPDAGACSKQRTLQVLVDQLAGLARSSRCWLCTRTCTGSTRPRSSC